MSTVTSNQNLNAGAADESGAKSGSASDGVSPTRLVSMIRENPLLLAQIVTENNPGAVSANMVSLGLIGSDTVNPDLLDNLLDIAPRLSTVDLKYILDVPFDYDDNQGPEATNAGMYEAFRIGAAQQGLTDDEATWSTAFPDAAANIGQAQADFHGNQYNPPASSGGKCPQCRILMMRRITYGLMGIALLLFIALLIKKL